MKTNSSKDRSSGRASSLKHQNQKWMFVVALASFSLGATGGVLAAKGKEIVVTPDEELQFHPLDPRDKDGQGAEFPWCSAT